MNKHIAPDRLRPCPQRLLQDQLHHGQSRWRRSRQSIWEHRIINGMVEINPVDTGSICPGGIAKVHTEVALNGLAAYDWAHRLAGHRQPRHRQVWCKSAAHTTPSSPKRANCCR